jgi:hypothetical protein
MDENADAIERHIDEERARLGSTVDALESRAARAVDWRAQFRERPGTGLALAFGAGALAAAVLGSDGYSDRRQYRGHSRARAAITGLETAVLGILANEARRYMREHFNSDDQVASAQWTDGHASPQRPDRRHDRQFDEYNG